MQEKKIKELLVSLLMIVSPFLSNQVTGETVIEKIRRTGLLEVAIREDAVPFGYRDSNNNLSGLCLDFLDLLKQKIKDELQQDVLTIKLYKSTLFNRYDLVENRIVDLECGPNSIRKNFTRNVDFSAPFFSTGTQFIIKKENINKFNFNRDLSKFTLGVLRNTTNQEFIQQNYPLAQIQEFQGSTGRERGIQAVQTGKIDAFASDGILLVGEATILGLSLEEDYSIVPPKPLNCEFYGLLLPKNDTQWQAFVNSAIQQARTSDILKDWFDVVAPYVAEVGNYCQLPQSLTD